MRKQNFIDVREAREIIVQEAQEAHCIHEFSAQMFRGQIQVQQIPHDSRAWHDGKVFTAYKSTDQNLVPKPKDEMEARKRRGSSAA